MKPLGHIGYASIEHFGKFCLPDYDKLPPNINRDEYDNILLGFGVDDIQEIYSDILNSKGSYLFSIFTCLLVVVIYNIVLSKFAN